jgi:hypothetical protein
MEIGEEDNEGESGNAEATSEGKEGGRSIV